MIEILKVVENCKIYWNKGIEESQGELLRAEHLTKQFSRVAGICQIWKFAPGRMVTLGIDWYIIYAQFMTYFNLYPVWRALHGDHWPEFNLDQIILSWDLSFQYNQLLPVHPLVNRVQFIFFQIYGFAHTSSLRLFCPPFTWFQNPIFLISAITYHTMRNLELNLLEIS